MKENLGLVDVYRMPDDSIYDSADDAPQTLRSRGGVALGRFQRENGHWPLTGVVAATTTTVPAGTVVTLTNTKVGDTLALNTTRAAIEDVDTILSNAGRLNSDQMLVVAGLATLIGAGDGDCDPERDPLIVREFGHKSYLRLTLAQVPFAPIEVRRTLDGHILETSDATAAVSTASGRYERFGQHTFPMPLVIGSESFSLQWKCEVAMAGLTSADIHMIRVYMIGRRYRKNAA